MPKLSAVATNKQLVIIMQVQDIAMKYKLEHRHQKYWCIIIQGHVYMCVFNCVGNAIFVMMLHQRIKYSVS